MNQENKNLRGTPIPPLLAPVRSAALKDDPPEVTLDRLVRLATRLLEAPAGFMTLIEDDDDAYKCVFHSVVGLDGSLRGRRADVAEREFFARAFPSADARAIAVDEKEPFLGRLGARAFLGAPLLSADGRRVGSLCMLDFAPRAWTAREAAALPEIAQVILAEMRRQRALESARFALRNRETILSTVAHDLRTPLTSVILGLELLTDARLTDGQRERLELTRDAARSLDSLVGDLLQTSELDSGRLVLTAHHMEPYVLVEDAVSVLRLPAERSGIRLRTRAAPDISLVKVDYGKILRAFSNLIGNALKFTPRGGTVTVEAEEHPEGVRFSVTDTGKGIPEENLSRIFEAFWRGEQREPGGLGLGLSIVKSIVAAHGGEVGVESEVDAGSCFWFVIPKEKVPEATGQVEQAGLAG